MSSCMHVFLNFFIQELLYNGRSHKLRSADFKSPLDLLDIMAAKLIIHGLLRLKNTESRTKDAACKRLV